MMPPIPPDPSDVPEARVIVNGEPVEGADPLFVGTLADAKDFVRGLSAGQRHGVSIFTEGRVYDPSEL